MNNRVRILNLDQNDVGWKNTATLAGPGFINHSPGTDGAGTAMKLSQPNGVAFTADGMGVVIAGMCVRVYVTFQTIINCP
jgi:hypothetical protein